MVLAAGSSSRLGSPKQLLIYKGKSLLKNTVDEALKSGIKPIIIVLGASNNLVEKDLEGLEVIVVKNESWQEGIASSIKLGLAEVQKKEANVDGIIFMVCDQPYVNNLLLNSLLKKQLEAGKPIVASKYGDNLGTPALFHKYFFGELMKLNGDIGARKLIKLNEDLVLPVYFPKGNIDIDTKTDYDVLLQ